MWRLSALRSCSTTLKRCTNSACMAAVGRVSPVSVGIHGLATLSQRVQTEVVVAPSADITLSEADLEDVFSDDDFASACKALQGIKLSAARRLLMHPAFSRVADNVSIATVNSLLAENLRPPESRNMSKLATALLRDIHAADPRFVTTFRTALEENATSTSGAAARVLVNGLAELVSAMSAADRAKCNDIFESFMVAMDTRVGQSFVRALDVESRCSVAQVVAEILSSIDTADHPRSKPIVARPKPPSSSTRSHTTSMHMRVAAKTALVAFVDDVRGVVTRKEAGPASANLLHVIGTICKLAQSGAAAELGLSDLVAGLCRISVVGDEPQPLTPSVVHSAVQACQLAGGCLSAWEKEQLGRVIARLVAHNTLSAAIPTDEYSRMVAFMHQHRSARGDLLSILGAAQVEIPPASSLSPQLVLRLLQPFADCNIINLPLFLLLEERVCSFLSRAELLSREELLDIPELVWRLSELRLRSEPLARAAMRILALHLQDHRRSPRMSDPLWRASLRVGVQVSQGEMDATFLARLSESAAQILLPAVREAASAVAAAGPTSSRSKPLPRDWPDKLVAGGRFTLTQLRVLRDATDFLQVMAYSCPSALRMRVVMDVLTEVHTMLRCVASPKAWATLYDDAGKDADARAVVVSASKLLPLHLLARVSLGKAAPSSKDGGPLEPWLLDFVRDVAKTGKIDRDQLTLNREVSGFERTSAHAIGELCKRRSAPLPVPSYFMEELGVSVDLAWPEHKLVLEVDGPVHFLPRTISEQVEWFHALPPTSTTVTGNEQGSVGAAGSGTTTAGGSSAAMFENRRPGLGYLSQDVSQKTKLRRAALQACGWHVVSLRCFDVWHVYEGLSAPKYLSFMRNEAAVAELDAMMTARGLWKAIVSIPADEVSEREGVDATAKLR